MCRVWLISLYIPATFPHQDAVKAKVGTNIGSTTVAMTIHPVKRKDDQFIQTE